MTEGSNNSWPSQDQVILPLVPRDNAFAVLDIMIGHVLDGWSLMHLNREVSQAAEALVRPVLRGFSTTVKVRLSPTGDGGVRVEVFDPHLLPLPKTAEHGHVYVAGGVVRWAVVNPPAPQEEPAPEEERPPARERGRRASQRGRHAG